MTTFRVWAPRATTVAVEMDGARIPMCASAAGWWTVDVPVAGHGTDYAFVLDGPYSHEVRRFLCDNARMWLRDYHIDGLRLDAVHAIVDTSAVHILEQLAAAVEALAAQLSRHLVLIAESDLNDPRLVRSPEVGGYGLDPSGATTSTTPCTRC